MADPKLVNDNALALRTQVSPRRWERVVQEAQTKALVYEAVAACAAVTLTVVDVFGVEKVLARQAKAEAPMA